MWTLRNKTNRYITKQTHRYREQASGYQWGEEVGESVGLDGGNKDLWEEEELISAYIHYSYSPPLLLPP